MQMFCKYVRKMCSSCEECERIRHVMCCALGAAHVRIAMYDRLLIDRNGSPMEILGLSYFLMCLSSTKGQLLRAYYFIYADLLSKRYVRSADGDDAVSLESRASGCCLYGPFV